MDIENRYLERNDFPTFNFHLFPGATVTSPSTAATTTVSSIFGGDQSCYFFMRILHFRNNQARDHSCQFGILFDIRRRCLEDGQCSCCESVLLHERGHSSANCRHCSKAIFHLRGKQRFRRICCKQWLVLGLFFCKLI